MASLKTSDAFDHKPVWANEQKCYQFVESSVIVALLMCASYHILLIKWKPISVVEYQDQSTVILKFLQIWFGHFKKAVNLF